MTHLAINAALKFFFFSLQWFLYKLFVYFFLHSFSLCHAHFFVFLFFCLLTRRVWLSLCARVHRNWSVNVFSLSCSLFVSYAYLWRPKMSKNASVLMNTCNVYLQLNWKSDTYSIRVISCLGEVWQTEREQLRANERGTATDDHEKEGEKK